MRFFTLLFSVLFLVSCAGKEKVDKRTKENPEITLIKKRIEQLELLAAVFDEATTRPAFADCAAESNDLIRAICSISQNASMEQAQIIKHQLGEMSNRMRDEIFGEDCTPQYPDPPLAGCPVAGSLAGRLKAIEDLDISGELADINAELLQLSADVGTLQTQMTQVQTDITAAEADIAALEADVDNIIDNLIAGLDSRLDQVESDIDDLNDRLDDIETIIDPELLVRPIELCGTIAGAGPVYETVQLNFANTKLFAMTGSGGNRNLGLLKRDTSFTAPSSGTTLQNTNAQRYNITTNIGSQKCHAIVLRRWNESNGIQICWHVSNWNHSHSNLINLYNQVGRPDLTCVGDVSGSY